MTAGLAEGPDPVIPAHVEQGGAGLCWRRGDVEIRKASVSPQDNNTYLFTDRELGEQLLIDAADDSERVLSLVEAARPGGRLTSVVTTHRHWDHHRALPQVIAATGAAVLAGAPDADHLPVPVTRRLRHGELIEIGKFHLTVIGLRGHTPGSVALAWQDPDGVTWLFSGDSLFPGGLGRTRSAEDFQTLFTDVSSRVFDVFDDSTLVHPGHGDSTTLGAERPHLPAWRARGW
ncbi:MBL fold metallo-hydrolase [Ruania alkalisoli]|uniref:MBL fold metallo-hydrolase n=1 Tax=Ruania alkalisoli TaxID=2779775 RepID=A0A7M1SXR9_9MICO|nr:MBL fold metallo-hydrolase [Ruania alkalisoli]QOR72349.1 MBL fold metallo-hydrolase [Ruania alkalisoli]